MNTNYEEIKKQLELLRLNEEIETMKADRDSIIANTAKVISHAMENSDRNQAEIAKIYAETEKMRKETRFYPFVLLLSAMIGGAVVAIIQKLF